MKSIKSPLENFYSYFLIFASFSICVDSQENFQQYDLVKLISVPAEQYSISNALQSSVNGNEQTVSKDLFAFQDKTLKYHIFEFLKNSASNKCLQDLKYVFQNLNLNNTWALKLLDAFGKPESGFLQGNTKWLGEFTECVKIYVPPVDHYNVGGFQGKYCTVQLSLPLDKRPIPITTGICLPDSCNPPKSFVRNESIVPEIFSNPFIDFAGPIDSIMNSTTITCQPTTRKLTAGAISVIFLISIFVFLAVTGTLITVYETSIKVDSKKDMVCVEDSVINSSKINGDIESRTENDDVLLIKPSRTSDLPAWIEKSKPFFNCFCFITNGEKLLNTSNMEGQLPSLHGIRFLSMSWVILCHSYAFFFGFLRSPMDIVDAMNNWTFQVILNGFFSVDSFFLLSGFLMAYLFFQQAAKTNGKIPWVYFYVHRYLRLTPVYMMVIAFYTTLVPYLGSGPNWMTYDTEPVCQKYWWWNLLYINNFRHSTEVCLGWSWYLANDMQFFVISPLFLITLWRWPKIGLTTVGVFLLASFLANAFITTHFDLVAGLGNIQSNTKVAQGIGLEEFLKKWQIYFDELYVRPYTRISPYLVGIILAFILYKWKLNNYGKVRLWVLCTGWLVASGFTLACLFGLYDQDLSIAVTALYNAFSRTVFACGLSWVMFVCINGQGGPVNTLLSWRALIPLSRLTFSAYLVHPIVQTAYGSTLTALPSFSHITIILVFLGCLVVSYAIAFVTSLLFESPVIRLEKLIRKKFTS